MKVFLLSRVSRTERGCRKSPHPYWHLIERDVEVDFASPKGGKIGWSPYSDPYGQGTTEPHDLVSKGFLSDAGLKARLENDPSR